MAALVSVSPPRMMVHGVVGAEYPKRADSHHGAVGLYYCLLTGINCGTSAPVLFLVRLQGLIR